MTIDFYLSALKQPQMPQILQPDDYYNIGGGVLGILIAGVFILLVLYLKKVLEAVLGGLEMFYALFAKRPLFIHFYPIKKELEPNQIKILEQQFAFYNRLDNRHKRYFRHRLATFLFDKDFQGREGFVITEEVKILVSATAIMLTFGFRNYSIPCIKTILVYPRPYYSNINKAYHKGEYNARLKTLVLSWDNFIEGFRIEDDKLNLGIHEFAHAIHYNSLRHEDISSVIFVDTFNELREQLASNKDLKQKLKDSKFIRSYAFTNDSELLAVVIETFIEAPKEFKRLFPDIYAKLKQMLNFVFTGY